MKTFILALAMIMSFVNTTQADQEQNVSKYDLLAPSNVSQEQLEYALKGDLAPYADTFIECEEKYGTNAILLSSIAAIESGWGTSPLAKSKNNLFGWTASAGGFMEFEDYEHSINHVSRRLKENYLSEDGRYYSGDTEVESISRIYCESEGWTDSVCGVADEIRQRTEEVREESEPKKRTLFQIGISKGIERIKSCRIKFQQC